MLHLGEVPYVWYLPYASTHKLGCVHAAHLLSPERRTTNLASYTIRKEAPRVLCLGSLGHAECLVPPPHRMTQLVV